MSGVATSEHAVIASMGHMERSPQHDFQLWGHICVQDFFHMVLSQFGLIEFHWTATTPFKHTFQDSQESQKKAFSHPPPIYQAVTSNHPCNMSYSHKFSFKGGHEQNKGSKSKFVSLRILVFIFFLKKFNQTLTYKLDKHPCKIPFSQFSITKYQYSLEFKPHLSNNVCVVQEGKFDIFSFTVYCLLMWLNVQVNAKYVWMIPFKSMGISSPLQKQWNNKWLPWYPKMHSVALVAQPTTVWCCAVCSRWKTCMHERSAEDSTSETAVSLTDNGWPRSIWMQQQHDVYIANRQWVLSIPPSPWWQNAAAKQGLQPLSFYFWMNITLSR